MKLVRNLGDRYRLLSGFETVNLIDKTLKKANCGKKGLEEWQKRKLTEEFGNGGIRGNLDMPFLAYAWEEEETSGNFGWRLTFPFFFVFYIIECFIFLPLKWVFTGKYYLSQKSWFGRFGVNWYNKIYNRRW